MHPDLIAYVTGSLDEPARLQFEKSLNADTELGRQTDTARRLLAPLDAEANREEPPAGLRLKTLAFVAEHVSRQSIERAAKSHSETVPASSLSFGKPWWRRIDVIVAASIAVTVLGLLIPAVLHLRMMGVEAQCKNNLMQLWGGLNAYQTQNHALPDVGSAPRPAAGMVIPMLRAAGALTAPLVESCPGAADGAACLNVGLNELANMPGRDFEKTAAKLLPGYAYSLGFRDEVGHRHGPAISLPDVAASQMPILADAPGSPVTVGNSANHGRRGQNVLFADGHVAFTNLRTAGLPGDDIYLNQANRVAAGLGAHDVVLGTGSAAP